jgi:hypothetical protein
MKKQDHHTIEMLRLSLIRRIVPLIALTATIGVGVSIAIFRTASPVPSPPTANQLAPSAEPFTSHTSSQYWDHARADSVLVSESSNTVEAIEVDPGFRMCAMTSNPSGEPTVGLVYRETGAAEFLHVGDHTENGWLLSATDFDNETAFFKKDDNTYVAHLEQNSIDDTVVLSDAQSTIKPVAPAAHPKSTHTASGAFSNRVFQLEDGETFAINAVDNNADFVKIKTGNETYSLRREIVDTILTTENLTTEERLLMIISFPSLASVPPGLSAAEQAMAAEQELSERLIPPTETPPMDELERLRNQFTPPSSPHPDS